MNFEKLKKLTEEDGIVFMTYIGVMSQALLTGMIQSLESDEMVSDIPKSTLNNIFTVFIEMCQNIIKYSKSSAENSNDFKSNGIIAIGKNKNGKYCVCSQNTVSSEDVKKITLRLKDIKSLSSEEIKEKYRELRRNAINSHQKGAGIGFLEMAKKAEEIHFYFEELNNDKYCFSLQIVIKD